MTVAYFDTSALVKLVVNEAETAALRGWLRGAGADSVLTTSTLAGVELRRAARSHGAAAAGVAEQVLSSLAHITMTPELLADAGTMEPASLRSLDSIHLATARRVGSSLWAFVAYDSRLVAAATMAGLPVIRPA
ncbi:putative nucleic acid-binding protein [Nakamurella sp. UYEF19]|uniref:type II toxin-antitoxin system VapC family toxin n=1 Tax=Nakamurella sp. UYEF19 TaxID=1756392 RepID=UPI003393A507